MPSVSSPTPTSLQNQAANLQNSSSNQDKLLKEMTAAAVFNSTFSRYPGLSSLANPLAAAFGHPMMMSSLLRSNAFDENKPSSESIPPLSSALCFCPLHRGFHNSFTVYGVSPDGSVQFNPHGLLRPLDLTLATTSVNSSGVAGASSSDMND